MGDVNLNLTSNANPVIQEWRELNQTGEQLNQTTLEFGAASKKSFGDATKSAENLNSANKKNQQDAKKEVGIIAEINNNLKKLKKAREEANSVDGIKKLNKEIDEQDAKLNKLTGTTKKVGLSFKDIAKGALGFVGISAGIDLVKNVIGGAIKIVTEFDQSIADLGAITGLTVDTGLNDFKAAVLDVSKSTGKGASDIAKAFQIVGSAKPELLSSADALATVTEQAVILSKAGGLDIPAAADALTKAMNQFG